MIRTGFVLELRGRLKATSPQVDDLFSENGVWVRTEFEPKGWVYIPFSAHPNVIRGYN